MAYEGQRCYRHESPEEADRRLAAELVVRSRAEVVVPDRVTSALDHCQRLVTSEQWRHAVAGKVIERVPDRTWVALMSSGRRDRCLALANTAAEVLLADKSPRGPLSRRMRVATGLGRVDQRFARQLARQIRLPAAVRATAVGRGLQVTGILLCLANGHELDRCQCFVDLARTEFKQQVKQILVAAAQDWVNLALYPGRGQRGRTLGAIRPLRSRAEAQSGEPRPAVPQAHQQPTRSRIDGRDLPPHPDVPPMRRAGSDVHPVWPRPDVSSSAVWRQGPARG